MKKKKFEISIGGRRPTISRPSSMDNIKKDPLLSEEIERVGLDYFKKNKQNFEDNVEEKNPVKKTKKPKVSTDISDVAKDSVDTFFYSMLLNLDLSKNEQKIICYLYEKNKSLEKVVASRKEIQNNLKISEGGLKYNLSNLIDKGYLVKELIPLNESRKLINAFTVNLESKK